MTLLLLLVAVVVIAVAWRYVSSRRSGGPGLRAPTEIVVDATPDSPVGFGYKMIWLAIRSDDPNAVVEALGSSGWQRANWRSGVAAAYAGATFVSPAVAGWVFALDPGLPNLGSEQDSERWGGLMKPLAQRFADVQYFASHRVVDYHAWARFDGGEPVRAYAYLGESAETLTDLGNPTEAEIELGHDFPDDRGAAAADGGYREDEGPDYPSEDDVMNVAGLWSLDPTSLDERAEEPGLGWLLVPAIS